MKALLSRNCFANPNVDLEARKKEFEARIAKAKAKGSTDSSEPKCWLKAKIEATRPNRKTTERGERRDNIMKGNMDLAGRIFSIMENQSAIGQYICDTRHLDIHPGTMNFNERLSQAKRIHHENMVFAARLDKVQPMYNFRMDPSKRMGKGTGVKKGSGGETPRIGKKKPEKHTTGVGHYIGNRVLLTEAAHASASPSYKRAMIRKGQIPDGATTSPSKRQSEPSAPTEVLLEYTKIQNGRVIDVTINKDHDSYSIIGADIENGVKYELFLSSEEVTEILDGDILVTSTDNVEVWMSLLSKVTLKAVGGQPTAIEEEGSESLTAQDLDSYFAPHAPGSAKPSDRPGARAGSRVNDRDGSARPSSQGGLVGTEKKPSAASAAFKKKQLGPKDEAPGAFDAPENMTDAALKIQTKFKGLQLGKRIEARKQENGSGSVKATPGKKKIVDDKKTSVSPRPASDKEASGASGARSASARKSVKTPPSSKNSAAVDGDSSKKTGKTTSSSGTRDKTKEAAASASTPLSSVPKKEKEKEQVNEAENKSNTDIEEKSGKGNQEPEPTPAPAPTSKPTEPVPQEGTQNDLSAATLKGTEPAAPLTTVSGGDNTSVRDNGASTTDAGADSDIDSPRVSEEIRAPEAPKQPSAPSGRPSSAGGGRTAIRS